MCDLHGQIQNRMTVQPLHSMCITTAAAFLCCIPISPQMKPPHKRSLSIISPKQLLEHSFLGLVFVTYMQLRGHKLEMDEANSRVQGALFCKLSRSLGYSQQYHSLPYVAACQITHSSLGFCCYVHTKFKFLLAWIIFSTNSQFSNISQFSSRKVHRFHHLFFT